jgi:hypothetical protein
MNYDNIWDGLELPYTVLVNSFSRKLVEPVKYILDYRIKVGKEELLGANPIFKTPYLMVPKELEELKDQLE